MALLDPAPTATSVRHQLRAPPADFTGRKEELGELLQKMGQGGATISGLHGQGGIGKTALALKVAEALAPRYPDAQIDLDLRGVSAAPMSPAAVMAHVIRAFYPMEKLPEAEAELGAMYRSVLHGKRVLLLFDNARDRAQVEPLLPPSGCVMIVTSRQSIALPGLHARNLDELAPADAIALLRRIAPRLSLGAAAEIAGLCGRRAFALRLAGSALAEQMDLEPEEYVERLKDAQARLELIAASLSLSFDLLDARLQAFWCCLGVFPGDFDREATAAVGGFDVPAGRQALGELVKQSMVDYDPETKRYRLHDLAHVYAVSRLGEKGRYGAELRHAEHFKGVAAAADALYEKGGASITTGLSLFDREWANIEVGQAWAAAHAAVDDSAAALCSDYFDAGSSCFALRQDPRDQIRLLDAALAAARRLGRRGAEGKNLGSLGLAYAALGEPQRAIELYEQQLTIAREIGNRKSEGNALGHMGLAYAALGEPRRAIELYEQQLAITREIGDRWGEGNALGNLGIAYKNLGETRRAINLYEYWLPIAREIGDTRCVSNTLGNMGLAYAALGEPRQAIKLYEQQLPIAREIGDRWGESIASWNLGLHYWCLGELEKAITSMQVCVDFLRAIGHADAEQFATYLDALRARLR